MKKLWKTMRTHSFLASILLMMSSGVGLGMIWSVQELNRWGWGSLENITSGIMLGMLVSVFLVYPLILTLINLVGLIRLPDSDADRRSKRLFELVTMFLGLAYSLLYVSFSEIIVGAQWFEQLQNAQQHQPIWTGGFVTVAVIAAVGFAGYLILSLVKLEKLPPLVAVLSISGMYLGIAECILWCIQVSSGRYFLLMLFPANCILIAVTLIRKKIMEWNRIQQRKEDPEEILGKEEQQRGKGSYKNRMFCALERMLRNAELWPVLALLLMWPLLGIVLGILILFGQKPDAVIKAWTETAGWQLSRQTAPPNVMYDEHYLCTVAAGGHEKVVKPLRMGVRHGHRVVVNRQLCIANAFEQILEERTPRFHSAVRHFYDTCGFPLARLIRTKAAADAVYLIMKPLEGIFLLALYLCDAAPENRIALQYLPGMCRANDTPDSAEQTGK